MRDWINLLESIDDVTADETKFWFNAKTNQFIDHDIDTHHTKMLATQPEDFGFTPDEVAHHPHASGDYGMSFDEFDRDDEDGEEFADNDDMGMFAAAFARGWVRGGHFIDIMTYHEMGTVHHDGGIYLQGGATRDLQRCVRACVKRWPDLSSFMIESDQNSLIELKSWEQIDKFIKYGTV